jgi:shikimate kinase
MATGFGAAFGLDWTARAVVQDAEADEVRSHGRVLGPAEARLALESATLVLPERGAVRVEVTTDIPPRKGLKSSSTVALAVLEAAADHFDVACSPKSLLDHAAEAGLRSGTSRTGAYDDAAACLLGGLVLTDNLKRRILDRWHLPDGLVALVHVPAGEIASGDHRETDLSAAADGARRAFGLAEGGRIAEAMKANTDAYAAVFGADLSFTRLAVKAGAWAAGLSGTGPAQIALVPEDHVADFEDLAPFHTVGLFHGGPP